jgi:hypothetical protein
VLQAVKINFPILIQINAEYAQDFSHEIEKDNIFKKQGNNSITTFVPKENNTFFHNQESLKSQKVIDNDALADDRIWKISAYDYNNFYFNRCLGK